VSLTLEGTVTDEPIANAQVSATVAGQTFTTTADADGNYSLDIEIEETDAANAFITLNARGTGDQAIVEYTSLDG
jgi:phosphatidate phosphatase APP1